MLELAMAYQLLNSESAYSIISEGSVVNYISVCYKFVPLPPDQTVMLYTFNLP